MEDQNQVLAAYGKGKFRAHELQAALEQTWTRIIQDDSDKAEVAALLGIGAAEVGSMKTPPMKFSVPETNLGAGEVAVIVITWVANEVFLSALADLAKDKLEAKLKELWRVMLEPALLRNLPRRDSLGSKKDVAKRD